MKEIHERIWKELKRSENGLRRKEIVNIIGYETNVENMIIAMEKRGYMMSEDRKRYYAYEESHSQKETR